jgi:hypothetical protein
MRELFTLQEELDAIRSVFEHQNRCYEHLREILDPNTFKVTDQSRVSEYKVESVILESSLRQSARQILYLDRLSRDLKDTLHVGKYSLEIVEEDHGKAIRLFTVVTVIFLPLTFVATVLGMNTVDIRQMENSQVVYWEIALPLTTIIILVAWAMTSDGWNLQERWYGYKRRAQLQKSASMSTLPYSEQGSRDDVSESPKKLGRGFSIVPGASTHRTPAWSVLSPWSSAKSERSQI